VCVNGIGADFVAGRVQDAAGEGHIRAGGVEKDVHFVEAGDDINDEVDAAYRNKYRRYDASVVDPLFTPEARAATIELVPR